jgi:hypothetical protein
MFLRRLILAMLFVQAFAFQDAPPAKSAEIRYIDEFAPGLNRNVRTIVLNGPIESGDSEKIARASKGHYVQSIVLASPGGSVLEAIRISSFLNKYFIAAVPVGDFSKDPKLSLSAMPSGCVAADLRPQVTPLLQDDNCGCVSACAIVYLTAPSRMSGTFFSFVGIHRPYFNAADYAGLSEVAAKKQYKAMMIRVAAFLDDNDVPEEIIDRMMSSSSTQVHYLTDQEHQLVGEMKPYLEELLISRCPQHSEVLAAYEYVKEKLRVALEAVAANPADRRLQQESDNAFQQFTSLSFRPDVVQAEQCVIKQGWSVQMKAQGIR